MISEAPANWQIFCEWLFDQPELLAPLRSLVEMQKLRESVLALSHLHGHSLSEAELDLAIRQLQMTWIQRW